MPVGSQLQVKDPTTGKILSLTITGTEKFENKTLCKACVETGTEGNTSRFEYMWSEDKNTTVWTKYNKDGNISVRFIDLDGKKRQSLMEPEGRLSLETQERFHQTRYEKGQRFSFFLLST